VSRAKPLVFKAELVVLGRVAHRCLSRQLQGIRFVLLELTGDSPFVMRRGAKEGAKYETHKRGRAIAGRR